MGLQSVYERGNPTPISRIKVHTLYTGPGPLCRTQAGSTSLVRNRIHDFLQGLAKALKSGYVIFFSLK